LIVALLGVLKAGGAYLPLDPAYPPDRLAFMLEDSGAQLVLTRERLRHLFPTTGAAVLCLDAAGRVDAGAGEDPAPVAAESPGPVSPDSLAYVIYTSGSTGRPKGVMIQHRSLACYVRTVEREWALQPGDRVLQFISISFDMSVEEIFPCLALGATLVLRTEGMIDSVAGFLDACGARAVTVLVLPTAYWHEVASAIAREGLTLPPSVRLVYFGGDKALPERVSGWRAHVSPDVRLVNSYGPTEATVTVTMHDLAAAAGGAPDAEPAGREVPLGRPLPNVQLYVLDGYGQPAPVGVPGELHIGGVMLARGYLRRPGLTAERFVPDPFGAAPGGRLYRTGDLVRARADGALEFLGRADHQVKVRGFRVELGEVEAALARHPAVRDLAVVAREGPPGERRLVAYLLADPAALPPAAARRFLAGRLPDYMIPAHFVVLPRLPLTPNGKLDRRALPPPDEGRDDGAALPAAPRTALEARLVGLWEELLGVRPVGVTDSFFDLGGHSLLALRLITRLRDSLGRELPLATLLRAPTVERLAAALEQTGAPPASGSPLVPIQPNGSRAALFLVHPSGGGVLCYADLARALGEDQPVYGLQSRGLDDDRLPYASVEDMVAAYAEAIRAVQPRGPYLVGGWSLGGVIAFELARRLRRQGEPVPLLALLDSAAATDEAPPPEDELLAHFAHDLMGLTGTDAAPSAPPLAGGAGERDERLGALLDAARQGAALPPDLGLDGIRRLYDVFATNVRAVQRYRPETYAGPVLLLRAATGNDDLDATLGWGESLTPGLRTVTLPGDHYSILRPPHVRLVAETLKRFLEAASRAVADGSPK
jgi:amino acid adenylation domain-containing protein